MDFDFEAIAPLVLSYAVNLVSAIVILILGWILAAWLGRVSRRKLSASRHIDPTLAPMIAAVVRYLALVIVLVAVLAQFGIQTASILAVLGAAGLAIGLALQGTLSNVASGVMLLVIRPFNVGDYIDANGVAGTVLEIGLFATALETFDGLFVLVPNTQLFGSAITNYSRLPDRRIDVPVGISYSDDVDKALAVGMDILKRDERVMTEKAPQVMVTGLGESSVDLNFRCWTKREDYWDLLFDLQRAVKLRFDAEGISIPFPQRDLHLIQIAPPAEK
jgi:small conductance mechanosensitive channel